MIGRKIVDRIDELVQHAPGALPTIRNLQPPALRINTGNHERAYPVSPTMSARAVFTPNTAHTFGMPYPAACFTARVESPCGSVSETSSRSNRYSAAEQALASALKSSEGERSPLELQIRALQQATVTLSTRAEESRERAAKLRLSLAERDAEPDTYAALQQQRWREEKRQYAVDKDVEMLARHLTRLKADRGSDRHEVEEDRATAPALNNEAKRSANLARFFDLSPTRTSFNLNLKCRLEPLPRRMTMSDVSPLRLRPSSITPPPLRRLTMKHARPLSMAGEAFNPVKRSCRPRPGNSPLDAPALTKSTDNAPRVRPVPDRSVSSRASRLTIEVPSDSSEGRLSTRPVTPPLSVASGASSSSQGAVEEPRGIATIISHVTARTRSEILADLDKDAVHVPDYAVNLLGGFDLIHDEFHLPDRELFIKPREMKPIEVSPPPEQADITPPPSEESDTGPYTSFALPPFTVEPSRSHLSLNSPLPFTPPQMHRSSLQPLTPDSSSVSRSSTPTTHQPSQSFKGPRPRHSLLFYMRKHKENSGEYSSVSSSFRVESSPGNSPVRGGTPVKKRFAFFTRK